MTQQPNFAVNIVRSFTRLKSLFINFYADPSIGSQTDGVNIKAGGKDAGARALAPKNTFAGVIAFVVSVAVAIYFFSNQVEYKGPLAADYGDIAALVGFVLAGALYAILRAVLGESKK